MVKHKETCLKINSKQTVKFKTGSIVAYKIYADFEPVLKGVRDSDRNENTS